MISFLDRVFGRGDSQGSGKQAKARLQFVLLHDRLALAPDKLEAMKQEIIDVIKKYVAIDSENLDIALQRRESLNLLVAEIPFLRIEEASEGDEEEITHSLADALGDEEAPDDKD